MNKLSKLLLILALLNINSCEEFLYNCDECYETEPSDCELFIELSSIYDSQANYHVIIYLGKVEDNVIIDERVTSQSFSIAVLLNNEYSVVSSFTNGENDYVIVNSTIPKVKYLEDYCEYPCYFVTGTTVDMKIKYY